MYTVFCRPDSPLSEGVSLGCDLKQLRIGFAITVKSGQWCCGGELREARDTVKNYLTR